MSAPGWPASARHGEVEIRPLRLRDAGAWSEARTRNEQWLAPWEGGPPDGVTGTWAERHSPGAFTSLLRVLRREAKAGRSLPFAITLQGRLVGQVTVAPVVRGAFQSANLGYWVDGAVAGRGVMPTAVALVVDHCFGPVGLHRVEADIRPENAASRRVVEKLGFRREGLHERMLYIDGAWRNHDCFALTTEDVCRGPLVRWLADDTPPEVHRHSKGSH